MSETIGQQLKQARAARNLTIEKVVQATHIRARHIEAIEADDFEALPSPVQARAFLRMYSEFLGLSLDDMIALQRAGADKSPAALPDPESAPGQSQGQSNESGDSSAAEPVSEPHIGKALLLKDKTKELLLRIRQIMPRPKAPALPAEPTGEITPAESEPAPDTLVESAVSHRRAAVVRGTNGAEVEVEKSASSESEHRESQAIFTGIGETLRQRRESLSLTLDEIERHTHVRKHYLQALEAGEYDRLPSSVQTRGMLNNYAHFLDMDVDAVLLQFAEGLQTQRLERQPKPVERPRSKSAKFSFKINLPPNLRRYLSMDILVGGGLILLLLVLAIWGTSRIVGLRSISTPQSTAPSISDILIASPEIATATPSPANETGAGAVIPAAGETVVVTIPAAGQGAVQVVLVALEQAWVRVTVDGKKQFEGRVAAGTAYPFDGSTRIEVLTGNGAAVSVLFNQSDLGPMGSFGEVVDRIYTANAILNPTQTSTPTSTKTPIPSTTPRPSSTPRPSITPRHSPTPAL